MRDVKHETRYKALTAGCTYGALAVNAPNSGMLGVIA